MSLLVKNLHCACSWASPAFKFGSKTDVPSGVSVNHLASSNNSNTTSTITQTAAVEQPTTLSQSAPLLLLALHLQLSITTEVETEASVLFFLHLLLFLLTILLRPVTVKTGRLRPPLTIIAIRPAVATEIRAPHTPLVITTITILEAGTTLSAVTPLIRSSIQVSTKAQHQPDFTRNRRQISATFSHRNRSRPVQLANPQTILVNNNLMSLYLFFVRKFKFSLKKEYLSAASAISTRVLIYVFNLIHFINGYRLVPFNLLIFCLSATVSCFDLFQPICLLPDFKSIQSVKKWKKNFRIFISSDIQFIYSCNWNTTSPQNSKQEKQGKRDETEH